MSKNPKSLPAAGRQTIPKYSKITQNLNDKKIN
jgi:hypothetical protein